MSLASLTRLTIQQMCIGLDAGEFSARELVDAHRQRIEQRNPLLHAYEFIAPEAATVPPNRRNGPLWAIPFGVKDVLDAARMPCEMGSAIWQGNVPRYDAGVVGLARATGAIALGKTATAEFAGTAPPKTVNPINPLYTPGGSSSGSAAAVADGLAAFAFGTQTGGSTLRPAAFCGIVGFKPSYGLYPISGMLAAAHSFDTVGLFTRDIVDAALVHSSLSRCAPPQPATPKKLIVGLCQTHLWDTVTPEAKERVLAAARLLEHAGATVVPLEMPAGFSDLTTVRAQINAYERNGNMAGQLTEIKNFREESKEVALRGGSINGDSYLSARRALEAWRTRDLLGRCHIILAPVTPGEAPKGLHKTGDPRLQEIWTMLQLPSLSLPFGTGPSGLPLGVQLVAHRYEDSALLSAALLLEALITG